MNHDDQLPDYVAQALQRMQREAKQREDAAYHRGWTAATSAMVAAAKGVAEAKPEAATQSLARPKRLYLLPEGTRERVIYAFKIRPGSRPSEVVRWLAAQGDTTKKQTILTMIKRLKKETRLVPEGDGYKIAAGEEAAA